MGRTGYTEEERGLGGAFLEPCQNLELKVERSQRFGQEAARRNLVHLNWLVGRTQADYNFVI